mmetsp:Transcript_9552/g.28503  ORF Transcript_9552/g.28503 Transcript_9552/m.28503 type:complete len:220 (-) Transcript_9552:969-1628(-)
MFRCLRHWWTNRRKPCWVKSCGKISSAWKPRTPKRTTAPATTPTTREAKHRQHRGTMLPEATTPKTTPKTPALLARTRRTTTANPNSWTPTRSRRRREEPAHTMPTRIHSTHRRCWRPSRHSGASSTRPTAPKRRSEWKWWPRSSESYDRESGHRSTPKPRTAGRSELRRLRFPCRHHPSRSPRFRGVDRRRHRWDCLSRPGERWPIRENVVVPIFRRG